MRAKRVRFAFGRLGVQIPGRTVVAKSFFSEVFLSRLVDSYTRKQMQATVTNPLKALDFESVPPAEGVSTEGRTGVIWSLVRKALKFSIFFSSSNDPF
jgi:hypothetical protein